MDPAENDEQLAKRLNDNDAEYKVRMDQLLDDYVKREMFETSADAHPDGAAAGSAELAAVPSEPLSTAANETEAADEAVVAAASAESEPVLTPIISTPAAARKPDPKRPDEETISTPKLTSTQRLADDIAEVASANVSQSLSYLLPSPPAPAVSIRASSVSPPGSPEGPATAGRSSYGHLPVLCPIGLSVTRNARCLRVPEVTEQSASPAVANTEHEIAGDRGAASRDAREVCLSRNANTNPVIVSSEVTTERTGSVALQVISYTDDRDDDDELRLASIQRTAIETAQPQLICIDIESSSATEDGEVRPPAASAAPGVPRRPAEDADKANSSPGVILVEDDDASSDASSDEIQFVGEERPAQVSSAGSTPKFKYSIPSTQLSQSPVSAPTQTLLQASNDRLAAATATASAAVGVAGGDSEQCAEDPWATRAGNCTSTGPKSQVASSSVEMEDVSNDWDEHLSVKARNSDDWDRSSSTPTRRPPLPTSSSPSASGTSYLAVGKNPFAYNVPKISEKHPHLPAHQAASIHRWLSDIAPEPGAPDAEAGQLTMSSSAEPPPPDASASASSAPAAVSVSESASPSAEATEGATSTGPPDVCTSRQSATTSTPPVATASRNEARATGQSPRLSPSSVHQRQSMCAAMDGTFYSAAGDDSALTPTQNKQSCASRTPGLDASQLQSAAAFATPRGSTAATATAAHEQTSRTPPVAVKSDEFHSLAVLRSSLRGSADERSPNVSTRPPPSTGGATAAARNQGDSSQPASSPSPESAAIPEKRGRWIYDRNSKQSQTHLQGPPPATGNWQQMLSIRDEQHEERSHFKRRDARGSSRSQRYFDCDEFDKYAQMDRERGSPGAEGYDGEVMSRYDGAPAAGQLPRNHDFFVEQFSGYPSTQPVGYRTGAPVPYSNLRRSSDSAAPGASRRSFRDTPPPPYQPQPLPPPMVAPPPFAAAPPPPPPGPQTYAYSGYVTGFTAPVQCQWTNNETVGHRFFQPPGWIPSDWSIDDRRRSAEHRSPPTSWSYSRSRGGGWGSRDQHQVGGSDGTQRHSRGPSSKPTLGYPRK